MVQTPAIAVCPSAVDGENPRPWQWSQRWRDVLFVHWQVPTETVQLCLPSGLEVDKWQGRAWVSAVAFRLQRVRMRYLPALGPCLNLLELNLRTYVCRRGEPAIYFLSMHADNRLAVALARRLTPLPYVPARIRYDVADETGRFRSRQISAAGELPLFNAEFRPAGSGHEAAAGSLDAWLLERYCAYAERTGQTYRMRVEHPPWRVRGVTLQTQATALGRPWGFDLQRQPDACHYSPGVAALVWPFEEIT